PDWVFNPDVSLGPPSWISDGNCNSAGMLHFPMPLRVGDRVISVTVDLQDLAAGSSRTMDIHLYSVNRSTGVRTSLASAISDGSGNLQALTMTLGSPHTILATEYLDIAVRSGVVTHVGDQVFGASVDYDRA